MDPHLFVGREAQVHRLLDAVKMARGGNFQIAYVSGERGVGKSSLAKAVLHLAEARLNAAVARANLGGVTDFAGLGLCALEAAARDNESRPWGARLLKVFGDRIERVGALGVDFKIKMPQRDLSAAGRNLPGEMAGLLRKIGGDRAPMVLALDDINGLADRPEFAHWIKSAVEHAADRRGQIPVLLILVGLEKRRLQMMRHNPSVGRVFQPTLFVEPWTPDETREFFRRGFASGGRRLSAADLRECVKFSGGFPIVAQEIGRAVWNCMRAGEPGALRQGLADAADAIGLLSGWAKMSRNQAHRSILAKAVGLSGAASARSFSRRDLLEKGKLSEAEKSGLDAFFRRARKLGAIVPDEEGGRGACRFPTMLHALYFQMSAVRQTSKRKSGRDN